MQNCFFIVPLACLCYLAYNLILYKKHGRQNIHLQLNSKTNLLMYGVILLLIWTFQLLNIYNFISDDFSYNAVYKYSEQSTHWIYKITSSFSNKSGAFLLWLTCIACVGFAFTKKITKESAQSRLVYLLQAVSIALPLLLATMLFFTDAFGQMKATISPSNGIGFKPILYNKYNLLHAPLLFTGFAFYYYMYVIAICSLISKNDLHYKSNEFCANLLCKYNQLGALLLLSGTLLGSLWAYNSFGWGGFWSWDPIENAALIPLLLSFALLLAFNLFDATPSQKLFKLMIFIPLIIFPMLLLCTFIARGGASLTEAIKSVHSYAEANHIELLSILAFLLLVLISSILLFIVRFRQIVSNKTDNFILKFNFEAIALFKIVVLLGIAFVVLVGTCLPLFAGLLDFNAPVISSHFYVMWCLPLVSIFLILSSIRTFANSDEYRKIKFFSRVIFSLFFALVATVFAYFNYISQVAELFLIFACSLTFASHLLALLQHIKPVSTTLTHIGIAIFALSALLQNHYTVEEKVVLVEKQQFETNTKIVYTLNEIREEIMPNSNIKATANVSILTHNVDLELNPYFIVSKNNVINHNFPDYTLSGITDIYIQPLACYENNDGNSVLIANIIKKPFMIFVWVGGGTILVGLLLTLVGSKR